MDEDKDVWWFKDTMNGWVFSVEKIGKTRTYEEALEYSTENCCELLVDYEITKEDKE